MVNEHVMTHSRIVQYGAAKLLLSDVVQRDHRDGDYFRKKTNKKPTPHVAPYSSIRHFALVQIPILSSRFVPLGFRVMGNSDWSVRKGPDRFEKAHLTVEEPNRVVSIRGRIAMDVLRTEQEQEVHVGSRGSSDYILDSGIERLDYRLVGMCFHCARLHSPGP